ncbi:MAG: hypothetical protein JNJ88_17815 [Planctomycetes bacterium]|nr:hypothetical protein [Planctomycetota bacterium]
MTEPPPTNLRSELLERTHACPEPEWSEVATLLRDAFGADLAFLWIFHRFGGAELLSTAGGNGEHSHSWTISELSSNPYLTFAAQCCEQESVPVVEEGDRSLPPESVRDSGFFREVLEPMRADDTLAAYFPDQGRALGHLLLARAPRAARYGEKELQGLRSVVDILGSALARTRAMGELRHRAAALEYRLQAMSGGFVLFDGWGRPIDSDEAGERAAAACGGALLDAVRRIAAAIPMGTTRLAESKTTSSTLEIHGQKVRLFGRALSGRLRVWCFFASPALQTVPLTTIHVPANVSFTSREREVLVLLAKGLDNQSLAQELGIGLYTTKDHLKAIFRKLNVRTRAEAVAFLASGVEPVRKRSDRTVT